MIKIIAKKLVYAALSLLFVVTLTFFLLKAIPGDPFQQEQALPTEIYEALRDHYGLNDSMHVQYVRYIQQLISFDFGPSLIYKGRSVTHIIMEGLPISALLGAAALSLAIPCGILLGVAAATHMHRWQDACVSLVAIIGISVPSFILATLLQYILGIKLGALPIARWGTFAQVVMPALSLAALPTAFIAKMTRAKMIDELTQGYVTTAQAKGVSNAAVVFRHVLRNAIIPVISYIGPLTASIITGSFIVEKIFAIPGLGYWFVTSVSNRDYPLIMGITVFYCFLLLMASLAVDLACLWIDPRLARSYRSDGGMR